MDEVIFAEAAVAKFSGPFGLIWSIMVVALGSEVVTRVFKIRASRDLSGATVGEAIMDDVGVKVVGAFLIIKGVMLGDVFEEGATKFFCGNFTVVFIIKRGADESGGEVGGHGSYSGSTTHPVIKERFAGVKMFEVERGGARDDKVCGTMVEGAEDDVDVVDKRRGFGLDADGGVLVGEELVDFFVAFTDGGVIIVCENRGASEQAHEEKEKGFSHSHLCFLKKQGDCKIVWVFCQW